ncbi:MAG: ferritin family protein [Candidatus Brocadiia bacterium]
MKAALTRVVRNAIRKEQQARNLYLRARKLAQDPATRTLLDSLAGEEASHAALLRGEGLKAFLASQPPPIQDLRITEFLVPRKLSSQATFQDVLVYAMKREAASYWAYQALAETAEDGPARRLFRRLAQEERLHRNRLERVYDDVIFAED